MRKFAAILSAVFMVLSFAACAGNTEENTTLASTETTTLEETSSQPEAGESLTAESTAAEESTVQPSTVTTTVKAVVETTLETITTTAKPTTTTAKPTTTTTTKPTTTTTTRVTTTRPAKGILSNFESWDIYGNTVTQDVLKGKKLTMVNIWGTFCSPCINEMPGLGEIHREYASKGFQVLGIITDLHSQEAYYAAEEIIKSTNASYTHIAVSEDILPVFDNLPSSVPITFFVDENGVQVGEIYIGARDKQAWLQIVDSVLEMV